MPCLAHLGEVQDRLDEFRALGAEVIAVSQAAPAVLARHLEANPRPLPVVCDPERDAYRTFGLERASWATLLSPRSLWGYLKLMFRGWRPRRVHEGEDIKQLGGDFVIDAEHRLAYAHRSANPSDRPSVEELLAVVRDLS